MPETDKTMPRLFSEDARETADKFRNSLASTPAGGDTIRPVPDYIGVDPLELEYPNYMDDIRKYRAANVSEKGIMEHFADREMKYRAYGVSEEAIDKDFGRTPESKVKRIELGRRRQVAAYSRVLDMPAAEVDRSLAIAAYAGINPDILLTNKDAQDALAKKLNSLGVKMDEATTEQMWNAFKSQNITAKKLYFIVTEGIIKGKDVRNLAILEEYNKELQKLAPPVTQTLGDKFGTGAITFLTQQAQIAGASLAVGTAAAATGAAAGLGAAGAAGAGALGAGTTGLFAAGRVAGAFGAGMIMETGS
ncbi:MAG: hypothetical protein LBS93_03950, partial [Synergistaceae bacterium]|nr:hypothetical protein [Synergistaceae bacterium]